MLRNSPLYLQPSILTHKTHEHHERATNDNERKREVKSSAARVLREIRRTARERERFTSGETGGDSAETKRQAGTSRRQRELDPERARRTRPALSNDFNAGVVAHEPHFAGARLEIRGGFLAHLRRGVR